MLVILFVRRNDCDISAASLINMALFVKAVDLAKRFCDGSAPRTINGCLRTFVNGLEETGLTPALEKQKVVT